MAELVTMRAADAGAWVADADAFAAKGSGAMV